MKDQENRQELLQLLKSKSLKFGDFTLVSGKKSTHYFDSKLTTLDPRGAYLTGLCFVDLIKANQLQADAFGGMTLGADPIVATVAAVSHLEGCPIPAFIVRKEPKGHGTMSQIEGPVEEGAKIIIVDDVVTTAGSTLKAIAACESAGMEVVAVVALVDREEGGAEALSAYPFYPLFGKAELLD